MYNIYGYNDLEPGVVIDKIDSIRDKIDEEKSKGAEADKKKIFDLVYAQFCEGLKLSNGMKIY